MTYPQRFPIAHENLAPPAPGRGLARIALELGAIANVLVRVGGRVLDQANHRRLPRAKVIAVTEAIGHHPLPRLGPYVELGEDVLGVGRTTDGRRNLGLYVLRRLDVTRVRWFDHSTGWPRTEHPGQHPARATLIAVVEGVTVLVGHGPPAVPGAGPARAEWVTDTAAILKAVTADGAPAVWIGDPNELLEEVAHRLRQHGHTVTVGGAGTDGFLAIGYACQSSSLPDHVNGVRMETDHKRALLARLVLRRRRD